MVTRRMSLGVLGRRSGAAGPAYMVMVILLVYIYGGRKGIIEVARKHGRKEAVSCLRDMGGSKTH